MAVCPSLRGIDYMLEAKLASGRALEAEQKVEGASLLCVCVCVSMSVFKITIRSWSVIYPK